MPGLQKHIHISVSGWMDRDSLFLSFAHSDPKEITNIDILENFNFKQHWYIYLYIVHFKDNSI